MDVTKGSGDDYKICLLLDLWGVVRLSFELTCTDLYPGKGTIIEGGKKGGS